MIPGSKFYHPYRGFVFVITIDRVSRFHRKSYDCIFQILHSKRRGYLVSLPMRYFDKITDDSFRAFNYCADVYLNSLLDISHDSSRK